MSDEIALKVASRRTDNERKTGLGPPPDRINYLPWGTRSLKLAVSGTFKGQVHIRPEPRDSDTDRIVSYAKGADGQAIQLSWGGGWEEGVELKHEPGDTQFVYFNVTHRGENAAETYNVDIVARDEWEDELGRLPVTLLRPALVPQSHLQPAWKMADPGVEELILWPTEAADQVQIPFYLSRWWPEAWVGYAPSDVAGLPPLIRLLCRRNVGKGYSEIEVYGQKDKTSPETLLAKIDGDIQFPLVDLHQISADLYYMAGHWALRVWFFWLDKDVAQRLDTTRLNDKELDVLKDWAEAQEIPDAERVDLVFDKDLKPRHLCTDLHWHELWAPYEQDGPVRISIAGTKMYQVTIRGGEGLKVVVAAQARRYVPAPSRKFDPSRRVMERLYDPDRMGLGEGTFAHKHTPYFHDVEFEAELTSSDVRHG